MFICVNNVGPASDAFTIELRHGGFFVGSGHLRSYVDGKLTGLTGLVVIHGMSCGLRISLSNWATIV